MRFQWTKQFIFLVAINVFNSMSTFMINPVISSYLVRVGLDFQYTGLVSALMSWVAIVFRPFSGALSDSFDKKKVMFISYCLIAICMFLYPLSSSVAFSIAIRIIHGIIFALTSTISLSFSASFLEKEILAEGLGYLTLGTLIGQMFGPSLGSMVADTISRNMVFVLAGVSNVIALILIGLLPYRKEERKAAVKLKMENLYARELTVYVILIAILSLGNGIISYFLKDFGDYRGIRNINLFYTVTSVVMVFLKPIAGKIQDRKGIRYILYPGYILTAISLLMIGKAYSLLPVLVAAVIKAAGQGVSTPAIQSESVKIMGTDRSGVAVSTCYIGQDIGNAVGPTIASMMISSYGYETMFSFFAALMLAGFVIFFLYQRKMSRAAVTA